MADTAYWFRGIPGYRGYYVCDLEGNIYSLIDNIGRQRPSRYKLKPNLYRGHLFIELHKDGEAQKFPVAQLICTVFNGPPTSNELKTVLHKNQNVLDNRASNLEWMSKSYASEYFTHLSSAGIRVAKDKDWYRDPTLNKRVKLSKTIVREIKENINSANPLTTKDLAKKYQVTESHISNIKAGRTWRDIK